MNLYRLHKDPKGLLWYKYRHQFVPKLAYKYALKTRKRFPAGEAAILRDPRTTLDYVRDIIKGRWLEAEPIILKMRSDQIIEYAEATRAPIPELEALFAKTAAHAYRYAKNCLKARFPKGEAAIIREPFLAVRYAKDVIKGPWPQAEKRIATMLATSYDYAMKVLKDRFIPGEKYITPARNKEATRAYCKKFNLKFVGTDTVGKFEPRD